MRNRGFNALAVLLVAAVTESSAFAGKFAVVLHTPAGWELRDAEKISINGRQKFRRGSGKPESSQDAYKRLPQENLGASLVRVHKAGYLIARAPSGWEPVYPDGASFKGVGSALALWKGASFVFQADKGSKEAALRPEDVFAILPGGASAADAAVTFLTSEGNFNGVGEATPAEAFDERMSMLVGVASLATGASQEKLKTVLASGMTDAMQRSTSGAGRYLAVTQGLRFAAVSQKAFPADLQQAKLRDGLADKKRAIDTRIAILKTFGAGDEWDALIDKYGDLEEYDDAFADLRQLHERSFKASEVAHTTEGKRLEAEKQYTPALDEIAMAMKRNPGSRDLKELFERIRIERDVDKPVRAPVKELDRASRQLILKYVTVADSYMGDGKFSEAEGELVSAEAIAKDDPVTVLARAKLYRARKDLPHAIETLNKYDSLVPPDQVDLISQGTALRARVEYEMGAGRDSARREAAKAEAEGDYVAALGHTRAGLQLDPTDPELLFHAGLNAALTRNEKDAAQFWQSYLAASQAISSESKRRAEVLNLLPVITAARPQPSAGASNWFSNYKNAAGVFYDPVSLMPAAHPAESKGSKKQTTTFQWNGGALMAVRTSSQMPGDVPVTVYFDYFSGNKGVRRVSAEPFEAKSNPGLPKVTAEGTIGTGKGTYTALFNDPTVNPYLIEKLTGKRVGVIVAGNQWFHPFVWDGVHPFLAEYDAEGHVRSAKAIGDKDGGRVLDFQWQGDRLLRIAERDGDYRREMRYEGNRLLGESVQFRGKTSKISYKYNGERLAEAECDEDVSLDGRSRKVTFGN